MAITKEMIIGDVLDMYPETAPYFMADACMVHGANVAELIDTLNEVIAKR